MYLFIFFAPYLKFFIVEHTVTECLHTVPNKLTPFSPVDSKEKKWAPGCAPAIDPGTTSFCHVSLALCCLSIFLCRVSSSSWFSVFNSRPCFMCHSHIPPLFTHSLLYPEPRHLLNTVYTCNWRHEMYLHSNHSKGEAGVDIPVLIEYHFVIIIIVY